MQVTLQAEMNELPTKASSINTLIIGVETMQKVNYILEF